MAAKKLAAALLTAILQLCSSQITTEVLPVFLAPLENHTVTQGRDISFTCVVDHLHSYKVAWIKSDSRAILAIHTHMVTHNPRLSVTHNGHDTWKLHISNVQQNDSGTYMCQINTDPMRSQMGHMVVQIPPDIMDDESADGAVTRERGNIKLRCVATGIPTPTVRWQREDGKNITLRKDGREIVSTRIVDGETLNLTGVLRQDMGIYLCIATNGVRPSISKRYSVQVEFVPVIKVTNQLVGAPVNRNVTLQCTVEASPRALNTWCRTGDEKLLSSSKFAMNESQLNDYTWQMNLTIHNLEKKDFGSYTCSATNALGRADASVRLQELDLPIETTPGPILRNTNANTKKKIHGKKKTNRRLYDNHDETDNNLSGTDDFGTTQMMGGGINGGSSTQEGHRTELPIILPSVSPPWVILVNKSKNICVSIEIIFLLLFATIFLIN